MSKKRTSLSMMVFLLALTPLLALILVQNTAHAAPGDYNYGEAIQKSLWFYEAQRSGELPEDNRVNWRGDSGLNDGSDVGVDLTGGWYDAGDHVKFGFPMAFTATQLAWSVYEYQDAFEQTGQLDEALDNIKWATDYFLKAHTAPNELYGQVGSGSVDHSWWGPAEVMQMERPSYKIDASCPGSDLAGETAAAMASASILFESENPSYSQTLIEHAEQLFNFADTYRGAYSDCITDATDFYNSWSGYQDELTWAALWLHMATGDESYLTYAENSTDDWGTEGQTSHWGYKWSHAWDDKHYGAQVLLYRLTGDQKYKESIERNLEFWTDGVDETGEQVTYSPGGLAWLDSWGALRYSANASFIAFVYSDIIADTDPTLAQKYQDFAVSQAAYIMGDNPRNSSYIVGHGNNPPMDPHHRTAHGSWTDNIQEPEDSRHILYGALVGGPDSSDSYTDDRGDYVMNEVATDYNAGWTGVAAKMQLLYGGAPDPNFPQPETPDMDEFFVQAGINSSGSTYTEIKAELNNRSGWPARVGDELSFKYFVDLSEVYEAGYTVDDIVGDTNYNEGATLSWPNVWDASNHIYYAELDFTGTKIYPGGQSEYEKETQFRLSAPTGTDFWDPSNDWSYQEVDDNVDKTEYVPVYDAGERIFGQEPTPGDGTDTTPPAVPNGVTASASGQTQVDLSWENNTESDLAGYNVYRSTTSDFAADASHLVASGVSSGSFSDDGLSCETDYYYMVTAEDDAGNESAASDEAHTTTDTCSTDDTTPPAAPSGLTASALDSSQTHLDWNDNTEGDLAGYNVYRSTTSGFAADTSHLVASGVTSSEYEDSGLSPETTYYYVVAAIDTSNNESVVSDEISVETESDTGSGDENVVVQYRAADTNAGDNQIKPHFNIVNNGDTAISLSDWTIRYWYTIDGEQTQDFHCDYAVIECSNVSGTFQDTNASGADSYLEISFNSGAGTIAAGSESGEIQARFNKSDWSNYDESDDYSYDGSQTSFANEDHVGLYHNGTLVWGMEP